MLLAALLIAMAIPQPNAMQAYVAQPQPAFAWHKIAAKGHEELALVSQEWKGNVWKHDLVLQRPYSKTRHCETAFLVVTGDRVDAADLPFGQKLAYKSGLTVLTLFNVPNQPLLDRREDALIAYTFEEFLESGDRSWPLLFPMVNSVKRAMDAAEQAFGIHKFIVTGSSKRGWTTWLTGALNDPRVVAIAPVAFDNLNFGAQLQHQMKSWGHLSEMLKDYVSEGLTQQAESKEGQELIRMVDPFNYLQDVHVPVLIVRGANDPYWATDAMNIYWDAIEAPKELLVLPNEGHDFKDDGPYIDALTNLAINYQMALRDANHWRKGSSGFTFTGTETKKNAQLWQTSSAAADLRNAVWYGEPVPVAIGMNGLYMVRTPELGGDQRYVAYFLMFTRKDGSKFTSTVRVVAPSPLRQQN